LFEPPAGSEDAKTQWLKTTAGRVLFNSILPVQVIEALGFQNEVMRKRTLSALVFEAYRLAGLTETVKFLDRLKEFGFRSATVGGVSIGVEDLVIPYEKEEILAEAGKRVERFQKAYSTGQITFGERYNKVIDAWTHANNDIAEAMVANLGNSQSGFNSVWLMYDSGSRGSRDQIRQLAGMRGLMAKPQKKLTGGLGSAPTSAKDSPCSNTSFRRTAREKGWPTQP
jgi:DNA-directed RNA polymerase subunit beta'